MKRFSANIELIGANPFVFVPEKVLAFIFGQAGKDKEPIRVRGTINGDPYRQTLLRYKGAWRLYINGFMLKNSPRRIGEKIVVEIEFDPEDKKVEPHPKLLQALRKNKTAAAAWDKLTPSRRWEIVRYIGSLKTEESIDRNIVRAIQHLNGKAAFVGRCRVFGVGVCEL
jgi:uncharacterized protein YdeI (YjbR/CyaY-like superfamily)